jgi:hypothetical protein
MPQINDAEIRSVYSASVTLDEVEDNEPNTPAAGGGAPATSFDVVLEAVAGDAIGSSGANYTLTLTCIDETLAAPNLGMSRTANQAFNPVNGWSRNNNAANYFKQEVFNIAVPPGVRGHVFRYVATLVSVNNDIISFKESNQFVLA